MSKVGKVILVVCGLALISKGCDTAKEAKADGVKDASTIKDASVIGVTMVTHTEQAEQYYNLPSWDWAQAEIYSYDNGWNKVCFYVSGRDEPVEQNWYPAK